MSPRDYFVCLGCGRVYDFKDRLYTLKATDFGFCGTDKEICRSCALDVYQPHFLQGKAIYRWKKEELGRRQTDLMVEAPS